MQLTILLQANKGLNSNSSTQKSDKIMTAFLECFIQQPKQSNCKNVQQVFIPPEMCRNVCCLTSAAMASLKYYSNSISQPYIGRLIVADFAIS